MYDVTELGEAEMYHGEELDQVFLNSVQELKVRASNFDGTPSAYWKTIAHQVDFGRVTFFNLLKASDEKLLTHSFRIKNSLNMLISPKLTIRLTHGIKNIINQRTMELAQEKIFSGKLRYVRRNNKEKLTRGLILITYEGSAHWFRHYPDAEEVSEDFEEEARHEGIVIFMNQRLYLLGLGRRYIRLALAITPDTLSDGYIQGIVLTPDGEGQIYPYAYRFVMAHESDTQHFEALRTMTDAEFDEQIDGCAPIEGLIKAL